MRDTLVNVGIGAGVLLFWWITCSVFGGGWRDKAFTVGAAVGTFGLVWVIWSVSMLVGSGTGEKKLEEELSGRKRFARRRPRQSANRSTCTQVLSNFATLPTWLLSPKSVPKDSAGSFTPVDRGVTVRNAAT
jgi:hypothetical protein